MPNTDKLKSGDVITIEKFDLPRIGNKIKTIWCVYLGKDGSFDTPIYIYFCRTTTQESDFKPGGNRCGHKYKKFIKGQYGFEDDCILDYNERPYTDITEEKFNLFIITVKGHLPNNIMQEIWKNCSKYLLPLQKKSIRDSFLIAGIKIK